jgi:hypothetical protein
VQKQQNSSESESTTQSPNQTSTSIEVHGGPKQRTSNEKLRAKRKFPDFGDFWPPTEPVDVIAEVETKVAKRKLLTIPKQLTNLKVTVESTSLNGRTFSRQNVTFIQDSDPNFDHVKLYVKGYATDNVLGDTGTDIGKTETLPFVEVANALKSPVTFVLEATTEQVVIGVQAINSDGVGTDIKEMPTFAVDLI